MTTNFNNQSEEENLFFDKNKKNPFDVPEGYFDSFAIKVFNKIEIQEELKQYSILFAIGSPQPSQKGRGYFSVPKNYFITNENLLEYKYELSAYSELSKVPKPALKPLAEDYSESLSAKIFKQIEAAEELKSFSTLYELKKENIFTINADYFETFADKVKERHHSNNRSSVSTVEQALRFIFKTKIAFTFSIILIVGVGAFFYFNKPNETIASDDCKTLACLERKELLNEHTIQNLDEDNLYDLVDVDQLDKQLIGATADSISTNIDSLLKK